MIEEPTTLVLGAGASVAYGFPTGFELKKQICSLLSKETYNHNNPPEQIRKLTKMGFQTEKIFSFCDYFAKSPIPTIDEFITRNPFYSNLAKAAIVLVLASCENETIFALKSPSDSWYHHLFNVMLEGTEHHTFFTTNKIKFITYNYDRSLEHFFYYSLKNTFSDVQEEEIIKSLKNLKIVHIHGKLGNLLWENGSNSRQYQFHNDVDEIKIAYNSIITFNEARVGDNPYQIARQMIRNSAKVVFLGFGFHLYNVEKLNTDTCLEKKHIVGTRRGVQDQKMSQVRGIIKNPEMSNLKNEDILPFVRDLF